MCFTPIPAQISYLHQEHELLTYIHENRYYNLSWEQIYEISTLDTIDYLKDNFDYIIQNTSGKDLKTSTEKFISINFNVDSLTELPIFAFEDYNYGENNLKNII